MKTGNKNKIRIFLIGPSYPFRGGIAHYTTLLYKHLIEEFPVTFYAFKRQYFKLLYPGKDDRDVSHYKIDDEKIKKTLDTYNPFSWIMAGIKARKYDLLILPWWVFFFAPYYYLFLLFSKNRHNRVIFICHNVIDHESNAIKKWISKRILKFGNGFVLHSKDGEEQLRALLDEKDACSLVSPHPAYQVFDRNQFHKESARKVLDIPQNKKVILFFGFIRKYKGLDHLIRALPMVAAQYPEILLLVVGEAWGKDAGFRNLVRDFNVASHVRFINEYVPNEAVEKYFKASDFLVLPYVEGISSGILQIAFSMGIPVVGTEIGAFKDIVKNLETGLLVPPGDEKKLAHAIIQMYEGHLHDEMTKSILSRRKCFDWKQMVESIDTLYGNISKTGS